MKAIVKEIFLHSIPISMNKIFRSLKLTFKYFLGKNYTNSNVIFVRMNSQKLNIQLLDL